VLQEYRTWPERGPPFHDHGMENVKRSFTILVPLPVGEIDPYGTLVPTRNVTIRTLFAAYSAPFGRHSFSSPEAKPKKIGESDDT
jgi:hypothetical protein